MILSKNLDLILYSIKKNAKHKCNLRAKTSAKWIQLASKTITSLAQMASMAAGRSMIR